MEQYQVFQTDEIEKLNKFLALTGGEVVSYNPILVKYGDNYKTKQTMYEDKFTIGYRSASNLMNFFYSKWLIKEFIITPKAVYLTKTDNQNFKITKGNKTGYMIFELNKKFKWIESKLFNQHHGLEQYTTNQEYEIESENDYYRYFIETYIVKIEGDFPYQYKYKEKIYLDNYDGGFPGKYIGQSFEQFKNRIVKTCQELNWTPMGKDMNSYLDESYNKHLDRKAKTDAAKIIGSSVERAGKRIGGAIDTFTKHKAIVDGSVSRHESPTTYLARINSDTTMQEHYNDMKERARQKIKSEGSVGNLSQAIGMLPSDTSFSVKIDVKDNGE